MSDFINIIVEIAYYSGAQYIRKVIQALIAITLSVELALEALLVLDAMLYAHYRNTGILGHRPEHCVHRLAQPDEIILLCPVFIHYHSVFYIHFLSFPFCSPYPKIISKILHNSPYNVFPTMEMVSTMQK